MFILITGLLLGGTYALIAMGLNLQYGVARIMNLANGEMLVAGGFAAFWVYTAGQVSPVAALLVVAPVAFAVNWLIYRIMLRRWSSAPNRAARWRWTASSPPSGCPSRWSAS
jgi:branched-chain amino acid transport system permease protein